VSGRGIRCLPERTDLSRVCTSVESYFLFDIENGTLPDEDKGTRIKRVRTDEDGFDPCSSVFIRLIRVPSARRTDGRAHLQTAIVSVYCFPQK
jgi:hypothetical protein